MQYNEFGHFIRNKRIIAGITLNRFAFDNEIDPAILSRVENLKQNIKLNILEKIARGFNCSPAELLTEFEKL